MSETASSPKKTNAAYFIESRLAILQQKLEESVCKRLNWTPQQYREVIENKKELTAEQNATIAEAFDEQLRGLYHYLNDYRPTEMELRVEKAPIIYPYFME